MQYTVHKGYRYTAIVKLSGFERLASNADIASRLAKAGFSNIRVWGSGGARRAQADWLRSSRTAQIPSQISHIKGVPINTPSKPIRKPMPPKKAWWKIW